MSTDGSVGAAQTLGGPNYDIDAELGTQAGGNLFHSFQEFSIGTGESATFSGPGSVDNIISRVTGGELSAVDGLLASTIPGASLWLFNPAGVVFGPNASLDVSGSFHVSTADEVRFADGGRFSAVDPAGNGFSVAAPESFGFLGSDPAGITIAGSQLAVGEGEILSVVGGDVDITGASLATAGGSLNVLAADGAADANVVTGDLTGDADGAIAVSGSALASVGDGGGAVRIEGSAFVVDGGSSIISTNTGATDGDIGVGIDVETAEIIGASAIRTNALAAGDGGSIDLRADRIRVADSSFVTSLSTSSGDGGDINVSGERITFESTGVAISSAQADGEGGAISVAADDLRLTGSSIATTTQAASSGQGGDVVIVVGSVDILAGGADGRSIISTASFGQGQAGDIDIRAGSVLADAENRVTGAAIQSVSGGASNLGGQIRLNVDDLTLVRGGLIATDPGQNAGGLNSIDIAADTISIDGAGDLLTGISLTVDAGNTAPGTIAIRAGDIDLQNGGVILSATASDANASNILIVADRLSLGGGAANRRTQINSNAANGSTGAAGRVTIIADDIDLSSTALISSSTRGAGSGGVVDITANGRLALRDQSDIESNTSEDATGDAGLVSINTANLILLGEGSISSRTEGVGDAGSIDISARTALLDNENTLGFGGITTQGAPGSSGDAGNITLLFDDLIIRNSSQVSSNVFGTGNAGAISVASKTITIDALQPNQNALTGFSSSAGLQGIGDGDAGAITVTADRLTARGNTAQITSSNDGAGSAGTIDLRLTDGLILDEGADVFTESVSAGGGGITIAADNYVVANGSDSVITTTVADDAGNAGDIVIATPLLALGDSRVLARADAGRGGDIQISVEDLILSPVSDINAEAGATGIDGTVVVTAAEVDLTSGLAALDGRFLDVSSLLRERCAARRGEITSSFTFGGGGAILPDLDSPRLSFLEAKPTRGSAGRLDRQTILALPCPSAAS